MKQIVKLTEGDLHKIIEKTVRRIVKENYPFSSDEDKFNKKPLTEWFKEGDGNPALIASQTIDDYNAQEIAENNGYDSKDEAAAAWFREVVSDADFEENTMPKYNKYITDIPELNASMYYDWYAEYYFVVKNDVPSQAGMTYESVVRRAVRESINGFIKEDAGGATNCAGTMQTGSGNAQAGTNPESGQYTVPFGKVQRRKIYQPKEKAGGDVTKQSSNVDMTPAMSRKNGKGGSISIPKRKV